MALFARDAFTATRREDQCDVIADFDVRNSWPTFNHDARCFMT
jgi:hypothetical protein